MKQTLLLVAAGICLTFCFAFPKAAQAGALPNLDPEIIANSWQEQGDAFASVTLNGRELVRFKESANFPNVESKAEELADQLNELIQDDKFDAERLLPSREGELAAIRIDGATVIKFPVADIVEIGKPSRSTPLQHSWRIVNMIRYAKGVTLLPQSFLKLSEIALHDAGRLSKAAGHFSGAASWYGGSFNGRKTADGTIFREECMTAAHRSLPLGTKLLVMNRRTGDACVVKVNDRGPYVGGRVIDLSKGAARQLNMVGCGVTTVDCLVLGRD